MYKIIIYYNDLKIVKNICNNILFKSSNLHLSGLATTEKEFLELYNRDKPHIILLHQESIKNPQVHSIYEKVSSKIILCENKKNSRNSKYQLYLTPQSTYLSIKNDFDILLSNLSERCIRMKIHKILNRLGFDFKLSGTNYLFDAIMYSTLHKNEYVFENLERNVYPYLAEKFNVSVSNIKWSIIRSINNMNSNLNSRKNKKILVEFSEKITAKLLITEIVNRLQ